MDIIEFLNDKKNDIVEKWQNAIIDTYPEPAGKFLHGNKNQFANPIGFTVHHELPNIFQQLITDMNNEVLKKSISDIIRIRAVQDFTPNEALGFILLLKTIIKNEISQFINDKEMIESYFKIDGNIDKMMAIAFDSYLDMRMIMADIKLDEVKRRNQKMMERLSKKYQIFEDVAEDDNINN
jgi:hypothetical protein